jgi:hypothetical protein
MLLETWDRKFELKSKISHAFNVAVRLFDRYAANGLAVCSSIVNCTLARTMERRLVKGAHGKVQYVSTFRLFERNNERKNRSLTEL